jgi:hypothetical protein
MRRPGTGEAAGKQATGPAVAAGAGAGDADPAKAGAAPRVPTPYDLAERGGMFATTAEVLDPEDEEPDPDNNTGDRTTGAGGRDEPGNDGPGWTGDDPAGQGRLADDAQTERGLRGLVGGGSSQVSVGAALRARDATRPTGADLAAAEAELVIIRRGWVPREDLPPRNPRH